MLLSGLSCWRIEVIIMSKRFQDQLYLSASTATEVGSQDFSLICHPAIYSVVLAGASGEYIQHHAASLGHQTLLRRSR